MDFYKPIRVVLLICILLFLYISVSCSAVSTAYSIADEYLKYKLGSTLHLDSKQKQDMYKRVDALYLWHQENELAPTIAFIERIKEITKDMQVNDTEFGDIFRTLDDARTRYSLQVLPDIVAVFSTMSNEQVEDYIEDAEEEAQERIDDLEETEEERIETRMEDNIDDFDDWFGEKPNPEQQKFIRSTLDSSDNAVKKWQARGQQTRSFMFDLLRQSRQDTNMMTKKLTEFIHNPDGIHQEQYKNHHLFLEKAKRNLPAFVALLTDKQLAYFHNELDDLVEDLRDVQKGLEP